MGTGARMSRAAAHLRPPLPHRRYSVPETVMRKYVLTKQRSESSDSGVATVPAPTPETSGGRASPSTTNFSSNHRAGPSSRRDPPARHPSRPTSSQGFNSNTHRERQQPSSSTGPASESESVSEKTTMNLKDSSIELSQGSTSTDNKTLLASGEISSSNVVTTTTVETTSKEQTSSKTPSLEISEEHSSENQAGVNVSNSKDRSSPENTNQQSSDVLKSTTSPTHSSDSKSSSEPTSSSLTSVEYCGENSAADGGVSSGLTSESTTVNGSECSDVVKSKTPDGGSEKVDNDSPKDDVSAEENISSDISTTVTSVTSETLHENEEGVAPSRDRLGSAQDKPSQTEQEEVEESTEAKMQYLPVTVIHKPTPPPPLSHESPDDKDSSSSTPSDRSLASGNSSGTPVTELSFTTPSECCSTPADQDRASESCSITPVNPTCESETPATTTSSMTLDQPQSEHSLSTQDATLSVTSTRGDTPASTVLTPNQEIVHSQSELINNCRKSSSTSLSNYSMDHIAFMDENANSPPWMKAAKESYSFSVKDNNCSSLILAMAIVSVRDQSGEGRKLSMNENTMARFCGTSETLGMDHWHEKMHAVEIFDPSNMSCKDIGSLGEKGSVASSDTNFTRQDSEESKVKMRESGEYSSSEQEGKSVVKTNNKKPVRLLGSRSTTETFTVLSPPVALKAGGARDLIQGERRSVDNPVDIYAPYHWTKQSEEDKELRETHQRQRFWVHRKLLTSASAPYRSPAPIDDPLTACVGTGSPYRPPPEEEQELVVPRYSAMPRTLSMLVNTSSGDCSSNSNSDSEGISIPDSLDDRGGDFRASKHDSKPVRGDISNLLPDGSGSRRVNIATPRGKGKAFFVAIGEETSPPLSEKGSDENHLLSESMPEKLKEKLSQRQRQMQLKKQKKQESPDSELSRTPSSRKSFKSKSDSNKSFKDSDKSEKSQNRHKTISTQTAPEECAEGSSPQKSNAQPGEELPVVTVMECESSGDPALQFESDSECAELQNIAQLESTPEDEAMTDPIQRPITPLHSDKVADETILEESPEQTPRQTSKEPQHKSAIPVKKSPIVSRKLVPQSIPPSNFPQKPSQLPVRRMVRPLQQSPPIRRSANLLGGRFQQQFEVIPEEKSGSIESSTEDQAKLALEKGRRSSLPVVNRPVTEIPRVKHHCSNMDVLPYSRVPLRTRPRQARSSNVATTPEYSSSTSGTSPGRRGGISKNMSARTPARRPGKQAGGKPPAPAEDPPSAPLTEVNDKMRVDTYKGKAALEPHQEEQDLLTLSKGWINFYLLKGTRGTPDDSNTEDVSNNVSDKEERRRRPSRPPPVRTVTVVGAEDDRLRQVSVSHRPHTTVTAITNNSSLLPELPGSANSSRRTSILSIDKPDSEASTVYLQLPSPRLVVPKLLEGSGELAGSESSSVTSSASSDSEPEPSPSPAMLPVRWPPARQPLRRASRHRSRTRTQPACSYPYQQGAAGAGGWTLTVAGSNGYSQQAPDLEMRVSFPSCGRRPPNSQSDSGLGEDNNNNNTNTTTNSHDVEERTQQDHFLPPAQPVLPPPHHWTVTLRNPNQGATEKSQDIAKKSKRAFQCLPDLGHNKSPKKAIKKSEPQIPVTSVIKEDARKMSAKRRLSLIWPNVHNILESKVIIRKTSGQYSHEVKTVSQLLDDEDNQLVLNTALAITGSAIQPEKKPRVPTMSERDLTRR
ncbi:uncharacterized protein [Anabrus simplex]|uniref:uncharacterized protein n=1 Tax=Anabrus simplex TaxID=316456 RepID=UPI0035A2BE5E